MPTSFSTLFGSNLHGVKVTWGNDPAKAGDREMTIGYTLNMYSAKFTAGLAAANGLNPADIFYLTTGWSTDALDGTTTIKKDINFVLAWKNPLTGG